MEIEPETSAATVATETASAGSAESTSNGNPNNGKYDDFGSAERQLKHGESGDDVCDVVSTNQTAEEPSGSEEKDRVIIETAASDDALLRSDETSQKSDERVDEDGGTADGNSVEALYATVDRKRGKDDGSAQLKEDRPDDGIVQDDRSSWNRDSDHGSVDCTSRDANGRGTCDGNVAGARAVTNDYMSFDELEVLHIPTKPQIPGRVGGSNPLAGAATKRSENNSNNFIVRYMGSIPMSQDDLSSPKQSAVSIIRCIIQISEKSSKSIRGSSKIIYEWPIDIEMYMNVDEKKRVLKLCFAPAAAPLAEHPLRSIRFWGTGNDANSKHLAYVNQNKNNTKILCHVFMCDVPAQQVTNEISTVCRRIAETHRLEKTAETASKMPATKPENGNAKKMAGFADDNADEEKTIDNLDYLGMLKITTKTEKDVVNYATEKLYKSVPRNKWLRISLHLSSTSITFKEVGNAENETLIPVNMIKWIESSTKNAHLGAIVVNDIAANDTKVHVLRTESAARPIFEEMRKVCQGSNVV